MRLACLALVVLPMLATPAVARQESFSADYEACRARSDGPMEADACLSEELTRQEAAMEQALQAAMRVAEDAQKPILVESQQAWLTYREKWCGAKGAVTGSGRSVYHLSCMVRTTMERRRALAAFDEP